MPPPIFWPGAGPFRPKRFLDPPQGYLFPPVPTGHLAPAMLAELQKGAPEIAFVLRLIIAGVPQLYGEIGADVGRSQGPGALQPKILSWGSFARGVTQRHNTLELTTIEVEIDDTDQAFTTVLEGTARYSVRGAPASIILASKNVPPASWFIAFSGRIDTFAQKTPLSWTLSLTPLDLALKRTSLLKTVIATGDWPNADVSAQAQPIPIVYGKISSASGTNTGAVPTLYVDRSAYGYLVCAGRAKSVDNVYKDGLAVAAANYSISYPIVNGRSYTEIKFTTDQGTSVITCDVQGYESVGDGSGSLITDPATMLKHILVNWIYGDYKSGLWLPDSTAPVDLASFATTYFSRRGIQASFYAKAKRKGLDVVNEFLSSFEARAWWTAAGTIGFGVEDPTNWSYVTDHVLHQDELQGWSLTYPTINILDEVDAQYGLIPTTGAYGQYLNVKDLQTGEKAPEAISLANSPSFMV